MHLLMFSRKMLLSPSLKKRENNKIIMFNKMKNLNLKLSVTYAIQLLLNPLLFPAITHFAWSAFVLFFSKNASVRYAGKYHLITLSW